MNRSVRRLTLALLALMALPADAQTVVVAPEAPVVINKTVVKPRRRNRYFAARPAYPPPANNGARANITFEPYTRWYYPNENSYYPPLPAYPSIRSR